LAQGEPEKAQELFPQFQRAVDKAAARRVIHPRRAARLKARLHGRIKAA
jgi:ribosomal protein S20